MIRNRPYLAISFFAIAAVAAAYVTYLLYGWWFAPVPVILIGLTAWERLRRSDDRQN